MYPGQGKEGSDHAESAELPNRFAHRSQVLHKKKEDPEMLPGVGRTGPRLGQSEQSDDPSVNR